MLGLMRVYNFKPYCDYVVIVQVGLCLQYTVNCFKLSVRVFDSRLLKNCPDLREKT